MEVELDEGVGLGRNRNEHLMIRAISTALEELKKQTVPEALRESMHFAKGGLDANKALLLYVRDPESPESELDVLFCAGLTPAQSEACAKRRSTEGEGVSPSVIQSAIESREVQFIENSAGRRDLHKTSSMLGAHSVLCAPVVDPYTRTVIAILYFQNPADLRGFEESDKAFLSAYAGALNHGFGLRLGHDRRVEQLEQEKRQLERRRGVSAPEIVGDSVATHDLIETLDKIYIPAGIQERAKAILVSGPSGAGKDLIARYLHYYSPTRRTQPYVAYNAAGLGGDLNLAKAELFGHVKGAFSGAITDNKGLFREAHKGVLFLDEIGDMPLTTQVLLLRVLETRKVQPVGTTKEELVDVHLVLATNRDLTQDVAEGRFREDLYSRISALRITMLPLSSPDRLGDIRPLLTHYLAKSERESGKKTGGLTPEALRLLMTYSWPLNVRQIDNVCAGLVTYGQPGEPITVVDIEKHFPEVAGGPRHPAARELEDEIVRSDASFRQAQAAWSRSFIRERLERFKGSYAPTARSLGLHVDSLLRMRKRLGLREEPSPVEPPVQ